MLKNRFIKITISSLLVLLALWIAVPKVFVHQLFHHNHAQLNITEETTLQTPQSTDDCEYEKYNKPVYFNIFKFVSKLVPVKPKNSNLIPNNTLNIPGVSVLVSFLRAPPVTE